MGIRVKHGANPALIGQVAYNAGRGQEEVRRQEVNARLAIQRAQLALQQQRQAQNDRQRQAQNQLRANQQGMNARQADIANRLRAMRQAGVDPRFVNPNLIGVDRDQAGGQVAQAPQQPMNRRQRNRQRMEAEAIQRQANQPAMQADRDQALNDRMAAMQNRMLQGQGQGFDFIDEVQSPQVGGVNTWGTGEAGPAGIAQQPVPEGFHFDQSGQLVPIPPQEINTKEWGLTNDLAKTASDEYGDLLEGRFNPEKGQPIANNLIKRFDAINAHKNKMTPSQYSEAMGKWLQEKRDKDSILERLVEKKPSLKETVNNPEQDDSYIDDDGRVWQWGKDGKPELNVKATELEQQRIEKSRGPLPFADQWKSYEWQDQQKMIDTEIKNLFEKRMQESGSFVDGKYVPGKAKQPTAQEAIESLREKYEAAMSVSMPDQQPPPQEGMVDPNQQIPPEQGGGQPQMDQGPVIDQQVSPSQMVDPSQQSPAQPETVSVRDLTGESQDMTLDDINQLLANLDQSRRGEKGTLLDQARNYFDPTHIAMRGITGSATTATNGAMAMEFRKRLNKAKKELLSASKSSAEQSGMAEGNIEKVVERVPTASKGELEQVKSALMSFTGKDEKGLVDLYSSDFPEVAGLQTFSEAYSKSPAMRESIGQFLESTQAARDSNPSGSISNEEKAELDRSFGDLENQVHWSEEMQRRATMADGSMMPIFKLDENMGDHVKSAISNGISTWPMKTSQDGRKRFPLIKTLEDADKFGIKVGDQYVNSNGEVREFTGKK